MTISYNVGYLREILACLNEYLLEGEIPGERNTRGTLKQIMTL